MFGIFILLMFLSSYSIISERKNLISKKSKKTNYSWIIFEGLVIGGLTGFVGAGGGFLEFSSSYCFNSFGYKSSGWYLFNNNSN